MFFKRGAIFWIIITFLMVKKSVQNSQEKIEYQLFLSKDKMVKLLAPIKP